MRQEIQLIVTPELASNDSQIKTTLANKIGISSDRITHIKILKKSIDSRTLHVKIIFNIEVFWDETPTLESIQTINYPQVNDNKTAIIIGAGPAGLFAALKLIENGIKPIIIERGKSIRKRKLDIAQLNRNSGFNPESNYCFGEGGAGTFSDGKLYTRSKKKGNVKSIFHTFFQHGADECILYDSHPHIGSDKLPIVIENISNTIINSGGEIHFEKKMSEIIIENHKIVGCKTSDGSIFSSSALMLATGHSAHDTYEMLFKQGISLEQKGFAMGVRVEHPQNLIDSIQYHCQDRGPFLPAATYSLVEQVKERGVYSFCMCPGGHIVPASSNENEIVVNGMSVSTRNSSYANSGIVVEIRPEDIPDEFNQFGVLAGLKYQKYVEHLALKNNGGLGKTAPAQRLVDFVKGILSADLPDCSYLPGLISSPLHFWLPENISTRLREGFKLFDKKMKGFLTNDAVVVGVETRTSSSIRIPRDQTTGQHPQITGLFPCGEGSGYSGGITSSAIDGENAALYVADFLNK
jgi:uncharacterized FAD-dependent dehydrogenase